MLALSWIPLGAGGHSVRLNGIVYEAIVASRDRRSRCNLYHSVLEIALPEGRYTVETTPVPDERGSSRGVVAEGPVGLRVLGRWRWFRYEVRRWRSGIVPDIDAAVDGPVIITTDVGLSRRVWDLLPSVPRLTWGRDELHAGDMWSCNSITAWVLAASGIDIAAIEIPAHGRAPGWHAGVAAARRGGSARRSRGSGSSSPDHSAQACAGVRR